MASVNKVIVVGNLGADAELRHTQTGLSIANFRVASNERWKNGNGEDEEHTEWFRCALFGKIADALGKYLTKGRQIYVEGRLRTNKWQDKEGIQRFSTQLLVREIQLLGKAEGVPEDASSASAADDMEFPPADVQAGASEPVASS